MPWTGSRSARSRGTGARNASLAVVGMLLFALALFAFARQPPQNRTLAISGYSHDLPVLESDGRLYVEIDALARLMNASVSYSKNQIVLALPLVDAARQGSESDFSWDFLSAEIEEMAVIRQWRLALANAIQHSYPVTEDLMSIYGDWAQDELALVSADVSTESDRNAYELLANECGNMKQMSDRFVGLSKSRIYIPTTALDDDSLDHKILTCAHSLAAMGTSGKFADDNSCH